MTTMIELVAESQAKFDGRSLIGMPRGERERYLERARLAIAAMREPTEGMLAGTEAPGAWGAEPRFVVPVGYENGPIYREQCAEIYQAMIDAALEEKP